MVTLFHEHVLDRICTKRAQRTMQNVSLVTTQSFNEGSLDMKTFAFAPAVRGYNVYVLRLPLINL